MLRSLVGSEMCIRDSNNNEILDASHAVAAGLIQNEININNKNRSKYTFRDDKRNLEKKKNFSFLKQWVGDNFF